MFQFATSPIGDMHINSLRVAIVNYLLAQQKHEKFSVRIDDIDCQETMNGQDSEIMMILEKFALKHDSVFHQTEHLNLHQTLALRLLKEKKAYMCTCTEDMSCKKGCQDFSISKQTTIKENKDAFVLRTTNSAIILKTDGKPSHLFASACDEMMNNLSLIITQEKQLDNAQLKEEIKTLLGYEQKTDYLSLPNFTTKDGTISIKSLFQEGFIPDAILNYLLLLGYKDAPKDIFTLPEAIEWFNLENISKTSVPFKIEELKRINRMHLERIDDKELSKLFGFADADIGKLAKLYLKEFSTINELDDKIKTIFKPKNFTVDCGVQMRVIANIIANAPAFDSFEKFKKDIILQSGLDEDSISTPLNYLLTGTDDNSVLLSEIYPFIKSYILEVAA